MEKMKWATYRTHITSYRKFLGQQSLREGYYCELS